MTSNTLPPGYQLDEYVIESVLGVGGFGVSYQATDPTLGTRVVIKEYFPQALARRNGDMSLVPAPGEAARQYEWGRQQFLKEVRALARFRHHHIVRVLRFVERNGSAYMIMEFEAGQGLHDYLHKHPNPDERTLMQVFIPILNGLQAVHQAGLLHLDIKPENIYLRSDLSPVLIDFGASKLVAQQTDGGDMVALSPAYAAIEQYPPFGKLGPWTDLYAIGASLYRCISGSEPVSAKMRAEVLKDGMPDPLVPAGSLGTGGTSAYLRECIDWAMQLEPSRRPQTATSFQDALMGKGIAGRKPEPAKRPPPPRPVPATPPPKAKSGMDTWKVVDSVTDTAPPPEEFHEPRFSGGGLKKLALVATLLAVIAGAYFLVVSNPGLVRQVTQALPSAGKVVDRAKEAVTGKEEAPVRYVGGVDPVAPGERKGSE